MFKETLIFSGVPAYRCDPAAQSEHYKRCWLNGWVGERGWDGAVEEGFWGPSWHRDNTHGVGEAGARAPASQHNDHIS
jgi:hypothetical protein